MESNIKMEGLTPEQFAETLVKAFGGSLEKFFKESGMSEADKKYLVHPDVKDEQDHLAQSKTYRLHSLLCALKQKDFGKINAKAAAPMSAGVDSDGGYLVPEDTRAEIMRLVGTFGQARQFMREIPMGKADTMNIPVGANGVTVNWVGENSKIGQSKPTLGIEQLIAKKAAVIVPIANELLQDASVQIGDYIMTLIYEALATEEDKQFFKGTGSPFVGVFNSANTFGHYQNVDAANLTYAHLLDMLYGVDQKYLTNAGFHAHRSMMPILRTLKDDGGNLIFSPATGSTPAQLFGYPIRLIEAAPTKAEADANNNTPYLVLGNLKNSFIGTKPEIAVKVSEDAVVDGTSLYEYDLSAIRVIERVAFNKGLTKGYSAIGSALV